MRIRVAKEDVDHYAKAQREGRPVRYQGQNWRVLGVTVDMMAGNVREHLLNADTGRRAQWWVELLETQADDTIR